MSEIDQLYRRTREGDREAFTSWVRLCEIPLRKGLRPFAPAVDVEAVLQEGLLRMWRLAPRQELKGNDASLRFALRLVRNLALSEAKRLGRLTPVELDGLERMPDCQGTDPEPDEVLHSAIRTCLDKLPRRPKEAIDARLRGGADRDLAEGLGMRLNTFLQNIVRARRLLAGCLRAAGIRLEEYLP